MFCFDRIGAPGLDSTTEEFTGFNSFGILSESGLTFSLFDLALFVLLALSDDFVFSFYFAAAAASYYWRYC